MGQGILRTLRICLLLLAFIIAIIAIYMLKSDEYISATIPGLYGFPWSPLSSQTFPTHGRSGHKRHKGTSSNRTRLATPARSSFAPPGWSLQVTWSTPSSGMSAKLTEAPNTFSKCGTAGICCVALGWPGISAASSWRSLSSWR